MKLVFDDISRNSFSGDFVKQFGVYNAEDGWLVGWCEHNITEGKDGWVCDDAVNDLLDSLFTEEHSDGRSFKSDLRKALVASGHEICKDVLF